MRTDIVLMEVCTQAVISEQSRSRVDILTYGWQTSVSFGNWSETEKRCVRACMCKQ